MPSILSRLFRTASVLWHIPRPCHHRIWPRTPISPSEVFPHISNMLNVRVLQARNLKNLDLMGTSDPYVKVRAGNSEASTAVKKSTLNPSFNEILEFEGVSGSDEVTILVMDKDSVSDKVMGSCRIPAAEWQSTRGARWFPLVAANARTTAGELQVSFSYSPAATAVADADFRSVWRYVGVMANRTALVTRPYNAAIEKGLDQVVAFTTPIQDKISSLSRTQFFLYLGAVLAAASVVSMIIAIPALILFPITFLLIVLSGFLGGLIAPIALIVGWVLACSNPVRVRVVTPFISYILTFEWGKKVLLED